MNNLANLTISVDSSFKMDKAATAYYIKHEKFVVKRSEFLGEVESSTQAEYQGLIRALIAARSCTDRKISRLYITCDCLAVIDQVKKQVNDPQSELYDLLESYDEVIPQHVNAHKSNYRDYARLYVNNWCDNESRRCLNENIDR